MVSLGLPPDGDREGDVVLKGEGVASGTNASDGELEVVCSLLPPPDELPLPPKRPPNMMLVLNGYMNCGLC